ncbi:MAG: sigma-54-dependent Fis family transcriptional regulator [Deltaproteobacteria bacterium]|nr:MAG: sigma-54-dependent Fis family transcriptional regulator [Deltaproteobacteria bacterium]
MWAAAKSSPPLPRWSSSTRSSSGWQTGSGKENAAYALHHWSPRREQKLLTVNCAALPEQLIESELFGYERGAFSGADRARAGLFEAANGGTLFLDEVGELSAQAQAKLLRAVESKRISRLGSSEEREIDVRLVAATNRSLESEIKTGRFRQDLFFRLSAATVAIPPLRQRPQDLLLLARRFLEQACAALGRPVPAVAPATLRLLTEHAWPGNVRELKNARQHPSPLRPRPRKRLPWATSTKRSGSSSAAASPRRSRPPEASRSRPPSSSACRSAPSPAR